MFKNVKLGTKLLLFVSVFISVLVIVIVSTALFQISRFNENTSTEQAVKGMEGLYYKIEDFLNQSKQLAKLISINPNVIDSVKKQNTDSLTKILNEIVNRTKIDFITITDNRGNVLIRTHDPQKKGDNIKNQANVRVAISGEEHATVEQGTSIKLSARAGVPIKNDSGQIIGVVSTGFKLDKESLVDGIKQSFKTDVTIFLGDTRLSTTVLKDGKRLTGTKLDSKIAEKVLIKRERYSGRADILGIPYLCSYMPLVNSENQAIGVLFSGQKLENVLEIRNNIILRVVAISIISILLLIALFYIFFSKSITIPLSQVVEAANLIADGKLDIDIQSQKEDEIGMLFNAFNKMTQNLNEIIGSITAASNQVSHRASQIANSSMVLSKGATEQSNSIQTLTASLKEVSLQTNQSADNASKTNMLAESTRLDTINSSNQMDLMLKAMVEINSSSLNISRIIKVIDDIAFQTSILSLNAAVEAARAGKYGKGFSVVAQEVRDLASRSANAAKETTDLIEGSIKKVEVGTKIANDTAEALTRMVNGVEKISILVSEIAKASVQQAADIGQINSGILQVSDVVNTNSTTSEETADASQQLSVQADFLKGQIARFKLKKYQSNI